MRAEGRNRKGGPPARSSSSLVLTVMGASGLVPNGIPLAVQPEDAGRWWLEGGELREVDPTGGEH